MLSTCNDETESHRLWETRQSDLALLSTVLAAHQPLTPSVDDASISIYADTDGFLIVHVPRWVDALFVKLTEKHGPLSAPFILSHCVESLLGVWVKSQLLSTESYHLLRVLVNARYHMDCQPGQTVPRH
jgi:hypothetical protein